LKIREVTLTVERLEAVARFYRDVLRLPVVSDDGQAEVTVDRALDAEARWFLSRVHHLAFGIAPADFALARSWLEQRVDLIAADGSVVIDGPDGWHSRSLYFLGPEDILLELIAREAEATASGSEGSVPRILSISEVGIGVPDVAAAVRTLTQRLALPTFPPQGGGFAPVGGHDGLRIVVDQDRIWFPELPPAGGTGNAGGTGRGSARRRPGADVGHKHLRQLTTSISEIDDPAASPGRSQRCWPDRGDQCADQEGQAGRTRFLGLRQLPATPPARRRSRLANRALAGSACHPDQRPLTTLGGVAPARRPRSPPTTRTGMSNGSKK
jgi:catechol 2,3-dioxygenase-like lactoylglutathione lyase family enzyme